MKVHDILQTKGRSVHSISHDATLSNVVDTLVQHIVGSLVVCDGPKMVGIITERDILRACAAKQRPLDQLAVREHMSRDVITGTSEEDLAHIMGLMTSHRIRHLPIVDDGQLAGIISIGDVVKAQHDKLTVENHYLKNYIHG